MTTTMGAMDRDARAAMLVRLACATALVALVGCARAPGVDAPTACGTTRSAHASRLLAPLGFEDALEDYDPWQPFNEAMFSFNHRVLDRWLMKPMATGWGAIVPAVARRGVARLFDNLEMPRKVVNNLLQARPIGAGRELARFAVNSTVGVAGLFDVATRLHIAPSNADAGETLALYGAGPGPYLVLPTFPPLTVRDAIGRGIDGALDPVGYLLPFFAGRAKAFASAVNERSLNLRLFADVEDSVIDLYSAARNGYLQRRRTVIACAADQRQQEWAWAFPPTPRAAPVAASIAPAKDPA
jgi:ABC-type transporter lipoprotein component MlaA